MEQRNIGRRHVVKMAAGGTAVAWAAPAVVTMARASAGGSPNPVCTPGDVVAYGATGWRFMEVSHGGTPGFEAPAFDDSGFNVGQAAFGSGGGCPLTPNTHWSVNTDMLLRRTVNIPSGASSVRVIVGIDNDVQVFWDGVSMGANIHEGCPTLDNFSYPVPPTAGSHVLAVRAIDRGGVAFVDVRVNVECLG